MNAYARPLPEPADIDNRPHWEGARQGRLMLQRCDHCGQYRFPAARRCPACRQEGVRWTQASGRGVIETWCRFHKAYWPALQAEVPYRVIQVLLDEGQRLYSNLVSDEPDDALVGLRVEAVFEQVDGDATLVRFRGMPQ